MKGSKTMTFRVNGIESESARFDGTPGIVRVVAGSYDEGLSFMTDAKTVPAFGAKLKVTVEWGEDE